MFGSSKRNTQALNNFDAVFNHAIRLREDVNIMQDEQGAYHIIRLPGIKHWSQHYETVTEIRMVPQVTGKKAQSTLPQTRTCDTPCSDAAGTCLPECPNLRRHPAGRTS